MEEALVVAMVVTEEAGLVAVVFSHTEEALVVAMVVTEEASAVTVTHMVVTAGMADTVDTVNSTLLGAELADTEPTGPSDRVVQKFFSTFTSWRCFVMRE